jgi:hypothetical protein
MSTLTKELKKFMSKFLEEIEATIKNIHAANGVDEASVTKEVTDAVAAGVAPLQTQLADQQTQISELQKALQDTVTALTNGDTATAQATASAAVDAAGSNGSKVAGGDGA